MSDLTMTCFLVNRLDDGKIDSGVSECPIRPLEEGEVLIEVTASSLNYKDAMAATGHPGIVRNFPHVPGIDSVGQVVASNDPRFSNGQKVIATGHEFGVERWGGWSTHVVAPGEWLVPLPSNMTELDAMTWGTAGFTAAQSVQSLINHGITPEQGKVIVSGATGGVGSLSVMLLAKLGFHVVAVTGKTDRHDWLRSIGAQEISGRESLSSEAKRPLLKSDFIAGIDTVGGETLATMLKRIHHRGCVACCGVTGGGDLPTTVYPFILRGLTLYGIDSAWCPDDIRAEIWTSLANEWKLEGLNETRVDLTLNDIDNAVAKILAGQFAGRGVIQMN